MPATHQRTDDGSDARRKKPKARKSSKTEALLAEPEPSLPDVEIADAEHVPAADEPQSPAEEGTATNDAEAEPAAVSSTLPIKGEFASPYRR